MNDTAALRAGLAALAEAEHADPSPVWEPIAHDQPLCGRMESVTGDRYRPCVREVDHREAYCRSANGDLFLAPGTGRL